jgi:hypothetical protein
MPSRGWVDWLASCMLVLMMLERTASGLEMQLRATGIGRFLLAGFLSFWLTGWAGGEVFALWMLVGGAHALLTTGQSPGGHHQTLSVGMAVAVGVFFLFWLTLWTFGGIAAGRELLRLLFGRDRFRVNCEGLEVEQSFGLFRLVKRFPREQIRRFFRTTPFAPLSVETTGGTTTVLTRLGTAVERAELEEAVNAEFHVEPQPASIGALPKGWCEALSRERDSVLIKDPATRSKQARTAWIICACLSLIPLYLLMADRNRLDLLGALIFSIAITGAAGWGSIWLSFGRREWRLQKGRLVLQRRFGQNRTEQFEAVSLELIEDSSGEDGPSYLLMAVAADAPPRTRSHRAGRHRRVIYTKSEDPTEPRNFGVWLSERCQIPLADETTTEAKAIELEAVKQKLANSGRLGRALLGIIERHAPSPDLGQDHRRH